MTWDWQTKAVWVQFHTTPSATLPLDVLDIKNKDLLQDMFIMLHMQNMGLPWRIHLMMEFYYLLIISPERRGVASRRNLEFFMRNGENLLVLKDQSSVWPCSSSQTSRPSGPSWRPPPSHPRRRLCPWLGSSLSSPFALEGRQLRPPSRSRPTRSSTSSCDERRWNVALQYNRRYFSPIWFLGSWCFCLLLSAILVFPKEVGTAARGLHYPAKVEKVAKNALSCKPKVAKVTKVAKVALYCKPKMSERQEDQGEILLYVETWPDTPQMNQRIRWASDVVKWRGGVFNCGD